MAHKNHVRAFVSQSKSRRKQAGTHPDLQTSKECLHEQILHRWSRLGLPTQLPGSGHQSLSCLVWSCVSVLIPGGAIEVMSTVL